MLRRYVPDARYQIVYPADGAGFLSEPGAKAGFAAGVPPSAAAGHQRRNDHSGRLQNGIESDLSDPAIRTVELRYWRRHLGLRV